MYNNNLIEDYIINIANNIKCNHSLTLPQSSSHTSFPSSISPTPLNNPLNSKVIFSHIAGSNSVDHRLCRLFNQLLTKSNSNLWNFDINLLNYKLDEKIFLSNLTKFQDFLSNNVNNGTLDGDEVGFKGTEDEKEDILRYIIYYLLEMVYYLEVLSMTKNYKLKILNIIPQLSTNYVKYTRDYVKYLLFHNSTSEGEDVFNAVYTILTLNIIKEDITDILNTLSKLYIEKYSDILVGNVETHFSTINEVWKWLTNDNFSVLRMDINGLKCINYVIYNQIYSKIEFKLLIHLLYHLYQLLTHNNNNGTDESYVGLLKHEHISIIASSFIYLLYLLFEHYNLSCHQVLHSLTCGKEYRIMNKLEVCIDVDKLLRNVDYINYLYIIKSILVFINKNLFNTDRKTIYNGVSNSNVTNGVDTDILNLTSITSKVSLSKKCLSEIENKQIISGFPSLKSILESIVSNSYEIIVDYINNDSLNKFVVNYILLQLIHHFVITSRRIFQIQESDPFCIEEKRKRYETYLVNLYRMVILNKVCNVNNKVLTLIYNNIDKSKAEIIDFTTKHNIYSLQLVQENFNYKNVFVLHFITHNIVNYGVGGGDESMLKRLLTNMLDSSKRFEHYGIIYTIYIYNLFLYVIHFYSEHTEPEQPDTNLNTFVKNEGSKSVGLGACRVVSEAIIIDKMNEIIEKLLPDYLKTLIYLIIKNEQYCIGIETFDTSLIGIYSYIESKYNIEDIYTNVNADARNANNSENVGKMELNTGERCEFGCVFDTKGMIMVEEINYLLTVVLNFCKKVNKVQCVDDHEHRSDYQSDVLYTCNIDGNKVAVTTTRFMNPNITVKEEGSGLLVEGIYFIPTSVVLSTLYYDDMDNVINMIKLLCCNNKLRTRLSNLEINLLEFILTHVSQKINLSNEFYYIQMVSNYIKHIIEHFQHNRDNSKNVNEDYYDFLIKKINSIFHLIYKNLYNNNSIDLTINILNNILSNSNTCTKKQKNLIVIDNSIILSEIVDKRMLKRLLIRLYELVSIPGLDKMLLFKTIHLFHTKFLSLQDTGVFEVLEKYIETNSILLYNINHKKYDTILYYLIIHLGLKDMNNDFGRRNELINKILYDYVTSMLDLGEDSISKQEFLSCDNILNNLYWIILAYYKNINDFIQKNTQILPIFDLLYNVVLNYKGLKKDGLANFEIERIYLLLFRIINSIVNTYLKYNDNLDCRGYFIIESEGNKNIGESSGKVSGIDSNHIHPSYEIKLNNYIVYKLMNTVINTVELIVSKRLINVNCKDLNLLVINYVINIRNISVIDKFNKLLSTTLQHEIKDRAKSVEVPNAFHNSNRSVGFESGERDIENDVFEFKEGLLYYIYYIVNIILYNKFTHIDIFDTVTISEYNRDRLIEEMGQCTVDEKITQGKLDINIRCEYISIIFMTIIKNIQNHHKSIQININYINYIIHYLINTIQFISTTQFKAELGEVEDVKSMIIITINILRYIYKCVNHKLINLTTLNHTINIINTIYQNFNKKQDFVYNHQYNHINYNLSPNSCKTTQLASHSKRPVNGNDFKSDLNNNWKLNNSILLLLSTIIINYNISINSSISTQSTTQQEAKVPISLTHAKLDTIYRLIKKYNNKFITIYIYYFHIINQNLSNSIQPTLNRFDNNVIKIENERRRINGVIRHCINNHFIKNDNLHIQIINYLFGYNLLNQNKHMKSNHMSETDQHMNNTDEIKLINKLFQEILTNYDDLSYHFKLKLANILSCQFNLFNQTTYVNVNGQESVQVELKNILMINIVIIKLLNDESIKIRSEIKRKFEKSDRIYSFEFLLLYNLYKTHRNLFYLLALYFLNSDYTSTGLEVNYLGLDSNVHNKLKDFKNKNDRSEEQVQYQGLYSGYNCKTDYVVPQFFNSLFYTIRSCSKEDDFELEQNNKKEIGGSDILGKGLEYRENTIYDKDDDRNCNLNIIKNILLILIYIDAFEGSENNNKEKRNIIDHKKIINKVLKKLSKDEIITEKYENIVYI